MKRHRIASFAITGIARYRRSELAARSRGCCRYAPSCSHYAETALRHRALPVALLLILWRLALRLALRTLRTERAARHIRPGTGA